VSIIDTTGIIRGVPSELVLSPHIKGYDWLAVPVFSFLVQHPSLDRSLIFDLGIRKDWRNLSPVVLSQLKSLGWTVHVEKDVSEILGGAGVDPNKVEAIIWSHHHFDHTGNPNTFPPSTSLIVGPGLKSLLPGYPTNASSHILESDLANRQLIELDFESGDSGGRSFQPLRIGRFRALDYFGDGSFFLLDSPGHTIGHISALARVTSSPASFVLLAGDAIHHPGEIRPSKYLPLPKDLIPDPFAPDPHPLDSHYGCPGAVFDSLFAERGRPACGPIYEPARGEKDEDSFHHDVDEVVRTIEKLQEADAHDNVFVAAAHDEALLDHVVFFPDGKMNAFVEKHWLKRVRWRFLRDFADAVGKQDHEFGRRHWGRE
jgi:glyoxylase-like metal-dependent hydrolase (beta-lactamase superfamily II)